MEMNGCHNREPLRDYVRVQNGWVTRGQSRDPLMVTIPDPMTKECVYTRSAVGQADPGCVGCKWRRLM